MFWELLRLRFCACIQYIHTCKLASSCSYRSKSTTYGALASGPRSSLRKIKLKFASEQHKKQADLKDIGAFLLIFSHPAFFASRLCRSDANFNAHFISHNYCAVHYYIAGASFVVLFYLKRLVFEHVQRLGAPLYWGPGANCPCCPAPVAPPPPLSAALLRGYADVRWSESSRTGDNRTVTYHSHEDFIYQSITLWSRENALNHEFSPGSYQFPFALSLQSSGRPLPPSFEGTVGHIRYEIEATIVKVSALKQNKRITARIAVTSVVDPNIVPNVRLPKVLQVEKTLCCLCCASGPICLTARVPRTGFCIIQDAIPFEVDIENGSNRQIRQLVAQLQK